MDAAEDLGVHGVSDAAGLRVLLAGVVDTEEARGVGGELCLRAVGEGKRGSRCDCALLFQDFQVGVPGDFSEGENRSGLQDLYFAFEIATAIGNFTGQRFVGWRRATDGRGYVNII